MGEKFFKTDMMKQIGDRKETAKELKGPTLSPQQKEALKKIEERDIQCIAGSEAEYLSDEHLEEISPEVFLTISKNARLWCVTKPRIPSSKLLSGEKTSLTINFTYNKKFNEDLYLHVTAGQVFPQGVTEIQKGKTVYRRLGTQGEFFDAKHNRLTILEGDTLQVKNKIDTKKQAEIHTAYDSKYKEFTRTNASYEAEKYKQPIFAALQRGIEPQFALTALETVFGKKGDYSEAEIELLYTNIARAFDGVALNQQNGRYTEETMYAISSYAAPKKGQELMQAYGYKNISKEQFQKKEQAAYKGRKLSAPKKYGEKDPKTGERTPWCSWTARKNLESYLGVGNVHKGISAKASYDMYTRKKNRKTYIGKTSTFPPQNSEATVMDLFLEASAKNKKHGHRAVAFKEKGEWFAMDPYYLKTRQPRPLMEYINLMKGKYKRKIWGGHLHKV